MLGAVTEPEAEPEAEPEILEYIPEPEICGAFELFPELPTEIRRQIWHLTSIPRVVPSKPIAGLQVNREARECLLEIYKPCFQPALRDLMPFPISIYANFETDTVLMHYRHDGLLSEGRWYKVCGALFTSSRRTLID